MDSISLGAINIAGWTENNDNLRKEIFTKEHCDIYAICETHLSKNTDFDPSVDGYKLYRHDRNFVHRNAPKTWGGVAFLIHDKVLDHYKYSVIDKTYDGIFAIELTHKYGLIFRTKRIGQLLCLNPFRNDHYCGT